MKGIALAILAGILFGCYNFSIKLSSDHLNEVLGAVILQVVALLLGLVVFLFYRGGGMTMEITKEGIQYAIIGGLFVGLAEIVSFYVFSQGVKPSVGITIIVGMTIFVGILLDVFWLKTTADWQQIIGILMVLIGVVLISSKSQA